MSVLTIGDKRLGAILLDAGLLTDEELQMALEKHREVGGSLAEVIVDSGLLSERRIAQAIEDHFGIPLVELHTLEIPPKVRALLPAEKAKELQAIPFAVDEEAGVVRVAFVNPLDTLALEEVEDLTGMVVEPYQATKSAFLYALAKNYPELGLTPSPPPHRPQPGGTEGGGASGEEGSFGPEHPGGSPGGAGKNRGSLGPHPGAKGALRGGAIPGAFGAKGA